MWKFEQNPDYIRKAYSTNNPTRLARDVIIGEYEQKTHNLNFRPIYFTSRGHSGTRCIFWILANMNYFFGRVFNLSGDSYHSTPEIRRRQKVTDVLHDEIIRTCCTFLEHRHFELPVDQLIKIYQPDITKLKGLFNKYFMHFYDPEVFSAWCWKETDSYIIFPIFFEVLREYNPIVIHLIRDGRDIAFKKHRTDSTVEAPGASLLKALGYDENTAPYLRAAASWGFQAQQFNNWKKSYEVMEIKYVDLASRPIDIVSEICARMGIPTELYDLNEIAKPIYSDRIRHFEKEDSNKIAAIDAIIGKQLLLYNYQ